MRNENFSVIWEGYTTDADAKKARDARWRELKAQGIHATRTILPNQLRKWASFGVWDGRTCNVYSINIYDNQGAG
ncbi:hypothetical protein LCGC14_3149450 [marine sediment metagenome]|uniref:Uncharacterized protein n=1 Tax=marine sediment metagenome TaxID=412755 RepID=A0A0F8WIH2_9ZZZZ